MDEQKVLIDKKSTTTAIDDNPTMMTADLSLANQMTTSDDQEVEEKDESLTFEEKLNNNVLSVLDPKYMELQGKNEENDQNLSVDKMYTDGEEDNLLDVPAVTDESKKAHLQHVTRLTPLRASVSGCVNCRHTTQSAHRVMASSGSVSPVRSGMTKLQAQEKMAHQKMWHRYWWVIVIAVGVIVFLLWSAAESYRHPKVVSLSEQKTEKSEGMLFDLLSNDEYTMMYTLEGNKALENVKVQKTGDTYAVRLQTIGEEIVLRGGTVYLVDHNRHSLSVDHQHTNIDEYVPALANNLGKLIKKGTQTRQGTLYLTEEYANGVTAFFADDNLVFIQSVDGGIYDIWALTDQANSNVEGWFETYTFVSTGQPVTIGGESVQMEMIGVHGDLVNNDGEIIPGTVVVFDE